MRITSPTNPRVKALARLKERRAREESGLFLIEGARELGRALAGGVEVVEAYCGKRLTPEESRLAQRLLCTEVSEAVLKKLSSRENPAGLIAVARRPQRLLEAFTPPPAALVVVAVGLEKPGNLGALLRSADAAGAHAALVVGGVDPYSPQVIHNSTGAVFSLPTFTAEETAVWAWLAQQRIPLVATSPQAGKTYWEADLKGPVALALGPEHEGLGPGWLERAALCVRVPMRGQADSLNVAVTAALVLYEALRQREALGAQERYRR
ncbi:RNA methyltransferase [Meiothermus sp. QL-1]|uniref:TrmH family RNA methyltransferase n=1 Tax=Meiothermus sp. QL-1 TaxID=2058095 RepID=UPI000E0AE482|nr:RNA methyltransferase [Meiothermus sp. QL-1]RDI94957.1 RNA methyltransferase [Meiothermus sp. QL-1]